MSDFGRSLIVDHRGFTTDLCGSARYMAPELHGPVPAQEITDDDEEFVPHLTKASDVYGFAMVVLEVGE